MGERPRERLDEIVARLKQVERELPEVMGMQEEAESPGPSAYGAP